MFKGFELKLELNDDIKSYMEDGKSIYESNQSSVNKVFDSLIVDDATIDGTKLQNAWFPNVKADIFLSHSHNDLDQAFALAGWMKKELKLEVFIDSCVWGSADALLKKIDDKYCRNSEFSTYNYKDRNYSTSHVHSMLSVAISSMINQLECLFFLNTPKSVSANSVIDKKTTSPWIYLEIELSRIIEKKKPTRESIILENAKFSSEPIKIEYGLNNHNLIPLTWSSLLTWKNEYEAIKNKFYKLHALEVLYILCERSN